MFKIIFVFLFISANLGFAASNLNFTNLGVGGGMNGTDWVSTSYFTFTNLGTVSGDQKFCRRVGDSLHCRGTVIQGTAVASAASIDLSSLTIALSKHSTSSAGQIVGTYNATDDSAANDLYGTGLRSGVLFIDGSDTNSIFFGSRTSTSGLTKLSNGVVNNNQEFTYEFTIPISGWTSGGLSGSGLKTISLSFGAASEPSDCTGSPCTIHRQFSSTGANGFSTVTRSGTGTYSINFSGGFWTSAPFCTVIGYASGVPRLPTSTTQITTSAFVINFRDPSANVDSGGMVICQGI